MSFEVGQTVSDYEILQLLGRGGMGCVYRVRNIISHRIEAMKVLLDDLSADPELAERFMSEIRTLARLDHPNIAQLHTAFTANNQLAMIMELLEGSTLAERIKQGLLPLHQSLDFISQILSALAYAHQAGVVHRDVKPSNVMITPHGIVKLMDFGIAKSDAEHNQTRTGMTMGSILYMSPEQVRGASVDARSDIYSVGIMLYELATGKRPFDGDNTHAILDAQLNQMPAAIANPAIPAALNEIILTAMAKDPMRRFQSAEAFRKALETLTPGVKTTTAAAAAGENPLAFVATTQKSNRGLWMALGAVACVCVLVSGAAILPRFFGSRAASSPAPAAPTIRQEMPAAPSTKPPEPATSSSGTPPPPERAAVSNSLSSTAPDGSTEKATRHSARPYTPQQPAAVLPTEPRPEQALPPQSPQPSSSVVQSQAGATPEQLEAANEDLMKLHARADAVRTSLDHLRSQQAADGLNLNPNVTAGASRMDNYLRAADQALQNNNFDSAQKYIDRANSEITKLESFFGR